MLETQAQNITSAIAFWPKQHKGNPDERMEKWIPLDGILLVKESFMLHYVNYVSE